MHRETPAGRRKTGAPGLVVSRLRLFAASAISPTRDFGGSNLSRATSSSEMYRPWLDQLASRWSDPSSTRAHHVMSQGSNRPHFEQGGANSLQTWKGKSDLGIQDNWPNAARPSNCDNWPNAARPTNCDNWPNAARPSNCPNCDTPSPAHLMPHSSPKAGQVLRGSALVGLVPVRALHFQPRAQKNTQRLRPRRVYS